MTPSAAPPRTRAGRLDLVQLLFNGAGRIGRRTFALAFATVALAWRGWGLATGESPPWPVDLPVKTVLLAAACAVLSKRLHDLSLAGWWSAAWVALIGMALVGDAPSSPAQTAAALLALLLTAALAAWPGEARFNRFGPSPREEISAGRPA